MKKMTTFLLFFLLSVLFLFFISKKNEERISNLITSFSFGEFQDNHENHLRQNLTDCFNIKLGFVYDALCKRVFSNSDKLLMLSSDTVYEHHSCIDGVFQIKNGSALSKFSELSLKFRIIDSNNYYLLKISIKPYNNINLIKIENGSQEQLKNQSTLLWNKGNIRSDIFVFYFQKYLLIINGDGLLAFYSCLENSTSGTVSLSSVSEKKAVKAEIVHSILDSNAVSCLEQELMYSHLIPDPSTYHWNAYFPEYMIPFDDKKHEFIQRVELGNITKPSILIPSGARVTANLAVRGASKLRVSLALVDKYIFDPERIIFKISIKSKRKPALFVTDKIDWNLLRNNQWKDLYIDLSYFTGEEIVISFQTEIRGMVLPSDDNIVSIWGSPEIITEKTPGEKNVILFILDAVRPDHLSCYGYQRKTSPTIDSLARGGALFKSAITAAPWTLPSHMAIFSGLYPSECGYNPETFNNTIIPQSSYPALKMEIRTLAEYLSEKGYSTAAFTGGGMLKPEYNFDQGFHYFKHLSNDKNIGIQIRSVIDWIKNNLDNKFFIIFHTYETHCPYRHNYYKSDKPGSLHDSAIDAYDSGIIFTDSQLKVVTDFLKTTGIFKDTLIIIMSDHGENFDASRLKDNGGDPCGSHGETLYDSELKIPLILTGAGIPAVGMIIDEQVRTVDILPTILDILDINVEHNLRGRSFLPIIEGKTLPPVVSYSEGVRATNKKICTKFSVRTDKYKLIKNNTADPSPGQPQYELYDLENDPDEKTNLKDILPSVLNKLTNIMNALRKYIKSSNSSHVKNDLRDLKRLGYIDN